MIISVLTDKRINKIMNKLVKDIEKEFEVTKASELEIDLNEFYYTELDYILEEYKVDSEVYSDKFTIIVDHLILKAKEMIYEIEDIAIEKVDDDTYIVSKVSPFRHNQRILTMTNNYINSVLVNYDGN